MTYVSGHYRIVGSTARAIAESVERGIRTGALKPGERLPAIRAAADVLDTSPGTVAAAYRQLRDRGLVVAAGRSGTVVSRPSIDFADSGPPVPSGVTDVRTGQPDEELLPDVAAALRRTSSARLPRGRGQPIDPGLLDLAQAAFAADGVPSASIAVANGAQDGIERALAARLVRGDAVAVEDPCYPPLRDLLPALGLRLLPVAIDDEGMLPEALSLALSAGAAAVIITPRAQNPSGAALSSARAAALRPLLAAAGTFVIEDDHAAAIAGVEVETLVGAGDGPWAVIRSTSKSLDPDLRVAVLTGDPTTVDRLQRRQAVGPGWVSILLQRTVATLWTDPASIEKVETARRTYAERRCALIGALAERDIDAHGRSGLNVWVPVREESGAVERLLRAGWAVSPGERYRLRSGPGLRITTARLPVARTPMLAEAISAALRGSTGPVGY